MVQLRVIIVGTSPAETLLLEDTLQQIGCLESFRYIHMQQAQERVPNWEEGDLLFARYQEQNGQAQLSLLAPVLRAGSPRVIFLVDPYDPLLVTRLLNNGAAHVLPVAALDDVLEASLNAVFGAEKPQPVKPVRRETVITGPTGQTEDAYVRLFRRSPIGISISRLRDGVCLECNESLASLLEWSREELIGRPLPELAMPQNTALLLSQASDVALPELMYERKIFTHNRNVRFIQVHLDRMDWGGEACVLSLVMDVTEREQAKEKARRLNDEFEKALQVRTVSLEAANRELAQEISQRKYLESFSNQLNQVIWETPDVVAIYTPDEHMQFLNRAGRELFGIASDGPVNHLMIHSVYSEETRRRLENEIMPVVKKKGIWRGEIEMVLPDGHRIPLSQVALSQKDDDGEILYYGTISRDVSDFKMVEKMLRVSRERYRTLAEAAHDLIFMVTKDGLMEYANGYACRAVGIAPEQVEGMPVTRFFPQDFSSSHLGMFNEVHEIDQPVYTEGPFARGGEQFWLGTWLVPIHDDQNNLSSILGISRDITEQKKTDEALQRALQTERELAEIRSNFFSMTGHQFRTPLSTILLSAEMLQKYGQRWDDIRRGEHLGRIQEAAKRLNAMLKEIMDIGKMESGRYVCTPKDFDLISFCQQMVDEMALNDQNAHVFEFNHDDIQELRVYHDQEFVHRVVDNLLSNAIKYSPAKTRVTLNIKMEDKFVLLEVADQGIGIPEQDLKFLFQPFQRGSNASDYPGTGIGLTIIQKSVDLMNGTVSLKSKVGQGTTFMIRFPCRLEKKLDREPE